ncbi:MAG: threonylcarbamoyl-AMP synthase [Oscillospiraceae bacterium]|nr:threonylcarbamoyl-AMP synthase [Oscillospiraceae bacterium]
MITERFTHREIEKAAALLREGQIVGMPTETVYGLGGNALDPEAVKRIFAAKGRPADNPLIVHIADFKDWAPLVKEIPPLAKALAERFWPGPLTIILPKSHRIPKETSGGLDTVGVRMPAHPMAQDLIRAAGIPIAAPSANRSGSPSPTCARHVMQDLDGKIPGVLDGGFCLCGIESTVVALDDAKTVRVLRPGFVTPKQLSEVAETVIVDPAVLAELAPDQAAPSPGMKYKHYAPNAAVILVKGSSDAVLSYIASQYQEGDVALVFDRDLPAYAEQNIKAVSYGDSDEARGAQIFSQLRSLDQMGFQRILIQAPRTDGVGLAVYNRLIRAAGYDVRDTDE